MNYDDAVKVLRGYRFSAVGNTLYIEGAGDTGAPLLRTSRKDGSWVAFVGDSLLAPALTTVLAHPGLPVLESNEHQHVGIGALLDAAGIPTHSTEGAELPPTDRVVILGLALTDQINEARTAATEMAALAYIGEHHFPDLTWKSRCEEVVVELREVQAGLQKLHDLARKALNTPYEQNRAVHRALTQVHNDTAAMLAPRTPNDAE